MKKIIGVLGNVFGGDKFGGIAEKAIPSLLKDHDSKLSSKRIFKIGSTIYLIYEGVILVKQGAVAHDKWILAAGMGLVFIGAGIGVVMASYIKEVQKSTNEKNKSIGFGE